MIFFVSLVIDFVVLLFGLYVFRFDGLLLGVSVITFSSFVQGLVLYFLY
jgi:hypothetical protein